MIMDNVLIEEQQNETTFSEAGTSLQNQLAIPVTNNSVVRCVSESFSSDEWSSSSDEDNGKQVAEFIRPHASTENGPKIINTYTDCTGISSTINNTTVFQEGVTVNQHFHCCSPSSLNYVLKACTARRAISIFILTVLGILLITFLGLRLSSSNMPKQLNYTENETTSTVPTRTILPKSTIFVTSPITIVSSTTEFSTILHQAVSGFNFTADHGWRIIRRKEWGAAFPNYYMAEKLTRLPPTYVVFSETGTDTCTTNQKCMEIVRKIQAEDLDNFMKPDIVYNFLIGGDGMVYEGRGWDVYAYVEDYDTDYFDDISIRVSLIGKFDTNVPTDIILQTAQTLLEFGVQTKKLSGEYKLICFRQLSGTIDNPGEKLYSIIKKSKRWDSRTIDDFPPIGFSPNFPPGY